MLGIATATATDVHETANTTAGMMVRVLEWNVAVQMTTKNGSLLAVISWGRRQKYYPFGSTVALNSECQHYQTGLW